MNFASDNWAGAHPRIVENLARHADGLAPAYGNGELDSSVEQRFREIFETDLSVWFVATGTAANALAMTVFHRPGGVAFCHEEAHLVDDEGGAPEYYTGGGRLTRVPGRLGRIDPAALARGLDRVAGDALHSGRPTAVSLTQATETGTVYTVEAIAELAEICRGHGVALHMDGARFANALVALDASPADMTWRAGVDALSFGATKNGCWCAEALVLFGNDKADDMPFLRKRAGQLFSKTRFVAAQFEAYFRDGLWLETAAHANARAAELAEAVEASRLLRLAWRPEANEVFAILRRETAAELRRRGATFNQWVAPRSAATLPADDEILVRLVTSFATTSDDIAAFAGLIA